MNKDEIEKKIRDLVSNLYSSIAHEPYEGQVETEVVSLAAALATKGTDSTASPVEIKTIGQLLDELIIENCKIFSLIDQANTGGLEVQRQIQAHNNIRRDLVRAIDRRLGERDIGGRVHGKSESSGS